MKIDRMATLSAETADEDQYWLEDIFTEIFPTDNAIRHTADKSGIVPEELTLQGNTEDLSSECNVAEVKSIHSESRHSSSSVVIKTVSSERQSGNEDKKPAVTTNNKINKLMTNEIWCYASQGKNHNTAKSLDDLHNHIKQHYSAKNDQILQLFTAPSSKIITQSTLDSNSPKILKISKERTMLECHPTVASNGILQVHTDQTQLKITDLFPSDEDILAMGELENPLYNV
ncbi:hypothetical protein BJ742DRAFT_868311 [Cladochytrium replicatum]|nr:hypothetical protein BJ742DRAFT_868311 [Cladochytrium replicatum]